MFNFFAKKPQGTELTLKLSGLHCSSCSLNIDGELSELPGVVDSKTSYAKQECVVTYDPKLVKPAAFTRIIKDLGYDVLS